MKSLMLATIALLLAGISLGIHIGSEMKRQEMAREAAALGYAERDQNGNWKWVDPEETKRRYMRQGWVPL